MIRLKDSQEITASQIDAVVAALNTSAARTPSLIEQGMKSIHAAIAASREKRG